MCLAVYIASSKVLPAQAWVEEDPNLFIRELSKEHEGVRSVFSLEYVYYLGSHEGCGCGFAYTEPMAPDAEKARRIRNYHQLSEYLKANGIHGTIEIFACWDGDQAKAAIRSERIGLEDLETPRIEFKELHKYTLFL